MNDHHTAHVADRMSPKVTLAAGAVGNVIEWYDFALFGYLAVTLSKLFFPDEDETAALIATYGVFAVGFIMRPLGSLLFGHLGDTIGRKPTLLLSVLMMAVPTVAIGLLPTYADWGIWASAALVALRIVQGLSVGGEFAGSVTYLIETARPGRRGFAGSFAPMGYVIGMVLGAGIPALLIGLLGEHAMAVWGWRVAFLIGGVLGIIAIMLRRHLPEAPPVTSDAGGGQQTWPIRQVLKKESDVLVRVFVYCCGLGVTVYLISVYLPNWLSLHTHLDLETALFVATMGLALQAALIPLMGMLSDRYIRRKRLLAWSFVVVALVTLPLFDVAHQGAPWVAIVVTIVLMVLIAVPLGATPATLSEAFDRGHRLTGYSLSYNLGVGIAGGTSPVVATWLIEETGLDVAPAVYLALWALVGAAAISIIKDRSREPLR